MDFSYSDRDLDASYDSSSAVPITLSGDTASASGSGVTVSGGTVTITSAGTYVLSGDLDGQVVVDVDGSSKVQLVLDGVDITDDDGPALYIKSADKVFITLAEGSENNVADGASYELEEGADEPDGTIFSKADLTFNGSGSLTVEARYQDAIVSKDDLVFTGGIYTIDAVDDGIRGKDCVKVCGGVFDVNVGGDGIKATDDSDTTCGFVSIDGGTFDIAAGDDGIQGETYVRIMEGGISIDAADDTLHSNGDALIQDGDIYLAAGDDGVHADATLTVAGGSTTIASCYEGFEGATIDISGGSNDITSTDDGINASSSATESTDQTATTNARATQGGIPTGMQESGYSSSAALDISGGYTVVDALGDGLDANGSISMSGGVVIVCGPTTNDNGSLDYDTSGTITGGTFIALGSSGMAQAFDTDSTQAQVVSSVSGSAGDIVSVCDAQGNVLVSAKAREGYQMVIASTSVLVDGQSYTICVGGTIAGADDNDYTNSGTITDGTSKGTITAALDISGSLGTGGMAGGGGIDGRQNTTPTAGGNTMSAPQGGR